MHLKSEVHELNQQQRDFSHLQQQIESLSQRVGHLLKEKERAKNDFEGQEKTQTKVLRVLNKENDDLKRMLKNKEEENAEIKAKIKANKERLEQAKQEYASTR